MAWGYEKGFCIEHVDRNEHKITCKDCSYYDDSDKSCMKRPLFLPADGYHSWKTCDYFTLDNNTVYYDEKMKRLGIKQEAISRKKASKNKNTGADIAKYKHEKVKRNSGFGYMELPFSDYRIKQFGIHHKANVRNCVAVKFLLQNGELICAKADHKAKILWVTETDMLKYGTKIDERVRLKNRG